MKERARECRAQFRVNRIPSEESKHGRVRRIKEGRRAQICTVGVAGGGVLRLSLCRKFGM